MADISGGPATSAPKQVLASLQVNPISLDGVGWRAWSVMAATTR
ncbi:MAG TPA: hypothetical protein VK510_04780 [Solirubrobacteraceae bacterium]|nr:hypothetical protein [Solirubrobacteraceae bacterium]